MAKNKSGFAALKAGNQPPAARAPKFKATTPGQEDVIFEYGAGMRPGAFQGFLEALSGHMASTLKKGGAQAAKAIRKIKAPTLQEPADPASNTSKKDEIKYKHDLKTYLQCLEEWEDTNGLFYEKLYEHC